MAMTATSTPTTPTRLRLRRAPITRTGPVYNRPGSIATWTDGLAERFLAGQHTPLRRSLQDDFPELALVFEPPLRVGGAGQREHLVDDGGDVPVIQQRNGGEQLRESAHVGAEDRQLAREEVLQVERAGGAGGHAARDQPSAVGQRAHAAIPGRLADVLDDDVGAAAAGGGARRARASVPLSPPPTWRTRARRSGAPAGSLPARRRCRRRGPARHPRRAGRRG